MTARANSAGAIDPFSPRETRPPASPEQIAQRIVDLALAPLVERVAKLETEIAELRATKGR